MLCANYCLLKMHCATFESPPPRANGASERSESVYATRPSPLDRAAQVSWVTTTHTQEILTISPKARTTTKYAIITPMSAHARLVAPTLSSMVSVRSLSRDVPSPDRVQASWETVLTWTVSPVAVCLSLCAVGRHRVTVSTPLEAPRGLWACLRRCGLRSHLFILAAPLRVLPYLMTSYMVSEYKFI